ncbi:alpha/beta fold hydrolase [Streptomyces sp. NPDC101181]|uniref:alpha/beta fold hydrolase n=1 Tax=Streptomyces sp. NPDC101181 TaxID=3366125 RepID=UPI00380DE0BC
MYEASDAATATNPADPFPVRRLMVEVNGAPFHVVEQGEGPAVLFCHGFPDTSETWLHQMGAVAKAGYRAIAPDMRGFGRSHAPTEAELYSTLHIAGDLVGLLAALDVDSAVVVGHDWGADHAQRAVVLRPDLFRALVTLSIPIQPRGELSHWDMLREQGLEKRYYAFEMKEPGAEASFEPAEKSIPSIFHWLSGSPSPDAAWDPLDSSRHMLRPSPVPIPDWADPAYIEHTIRSFEETGFRGGLNHYRGSQATFDLMSAFEGVRIQHPSLYIWGASDGLCNFFHPTPPTRDDLLPLVPGLVDVIALENVGHWPQHEAADRVSSELVKFLRGLDQPQQG